MQKNNLTIKTAFSDFQNLKNIHEAFIKEIRGQEEDRKTLSSLKVVNQILCVTFLELEFHAVRRTVASDFRLIANEYAFVGSIDSQEHVLFYLYLTPDGGLYLNSSLDSDSRLCDFNNMFVVSNILERIQIAALSSPFFVPHG